MMRVLDTGKRSATENMAIDAELLESMTLADASPTLHFYDWESPSATYGYFTDPATLLSLDAVKKLGLDIARRPTGGGVIFHTTDWAFSLAIPSTHPGYSVNTLDNYAYVNRFVIRALAAFLGTDHQLSFLENEIAIDNKHAHHFCMAKPTKYDVMFGKRKIGGAAQRRTRFGLLHQGSISLTLPDPIFLSQVLLSHVDVMEAMSRSTSALLPENASAFDIASARAALKLLLSNMLTSDS